MPRRATTGRRSFRTLLIVGEGDSELAFLSHLKSLYAPRGSGLQVTLRNAHGKGPEHVVEFALRQAQQFSYDSCAALLDTDLTWPPAMIKRARSRKLLLIPSRPCLEGLLLHVLARPVPALSDPCKQALHPLLSGRSTDPGSYAKLFPRRLLDERCTSVESLAELRRLILEQAC